MLDVDLIYHGSDGEATKLLYSQLSALGPLGVVAMNLFRACKCSERAKVYRGGIRGQGSYRRMAYDRKQWSIGNLCTTLAEHAAGLGIVWGWKEDPATINYPWVLYLDLPTGQVSFHSQFRGTGPNYPCDWDGQRGASPQRVIDFCRRLWDPESPRMTCPAEPSTAPPPVASPPAAPVASPIAASGYHREPVAQLTFF